MTAHGAPNDAAIAAAIEDAAQRLDDGVPSRDKWRRFMLAHGVAAFREIVEEVTDKAGIAKKGAYLNTRLDAYVPPAPPVHAANPHPPDECPHFKRLAEDGSPYLSAVAR